MLDSSVVIAGERQGMTVRQILEQLRATHGEIEMGLSVVTIVELIHGIQRAKDEPRGWPDESKASKPIRV
jgi:predicted nucleic acid-binding protein